MTIPRAVLWALCLVLLPSRPSGAAPIDPKDLPTDLRAWIPWVLYDKESSTCPMVLGQADSVRCDWPSRLELRLDDKGGTFTQQWHVHARTQIPLPGDARRWPQEVMVDRKRVAVVPGPRVELTAGAHTITGQFLWDSLPESLQIPPQTGLLSLTLRGKAIERPNRQDSGMVFLHRVETPSEGERLTVLVHRKVTDGIPLVLTTRIMLNVAGKSREVLLGKALPPGFVPMSLDADVPARLEPDSRVRVQVRPGTWTLTIVARSPGPVKQLRRPVPGGPWREGEEVWVFEAQSALRLVSVEGVSAVDPQQTSLPAEWKQLPAYPMKLTDTMQLQEKRRGDAEPTPDRLTLSRTLWLDFDGRGLTASDSISGTLQRPTRLELEPPTRLGRVSVGGRDQFITHLKDPRRMGVELRAGALSLEADSRIEGSPGDIPAAGWDHDFHKVSGELHLPPGWRLLHASGADEVPGTWLRHWTLLEIFLALVLSIAVWRLYGLFWGVLALVSFGLIFPESHAPRWVWVGILALEAVVRALPRGRLGKILVITRHVTAVALVLVAIPFLIQHVRVGLYPALELDDQLSDLTAVFALGARSESQAMGDRFTTGDRFITVQAELPREQNQAGAAQDKAQEAAKNAGVLGVLKKPVDSRTQSTMWVDGKLDGKGGTLYHQFNVETYDPRAMVQTGPGRPRWQWKEFALQWSGPVQRGQRLHLVLLSPLMNLLLALVRAVLLVLLVLRLVPWNLPRVPLARGAAAAVLSLLMLWPATSGAEQPTPDILSELQQRLLARPACAPTCASSPRMLLEVRPARITARVEIVAAAATAVPLPGGPSQWIPDRVLLDGKPPRGLARDDAGTLWLLVDHGVHQVILEGPMPDQESVQLALPLKPHRVQATVQGWTIDGLHEDGLADDDLQLTRVRKGGPGSVLEPGALPPFVRVERQLLIGLNWQVETRVVRQTPVGVAVVQEIPLLPGESVTTADVRVSDGKALVNIGPQATEMVWRSVLQEKSPLLLLAPRVAGWTEVWRLDLSPIWHAAISGIPAVHPEGGQIPEWQPWPGERLRIDITRPAGVAGQTITIDQSWYKVEPGLRATDAELRLELRSSRGAQHTLTLPEGATVETVQISGRTHPFRQVGRKVTLTLVPGSQTLILRWRDAHGVGAVYRVTPAHLGVPSVNASTHVSFSDARWILFAGGPRLGPVVRFWSLLLVLAVIALALARVKWVPLRWWHWMLLAMGLSQIHLILAAMLVGWLLLLGWRGQSTPEASPRRFWFNTRQIVILCATLVAIVILVLAVHEGLLKQPDMQIRGNDSTADHLRWFQDRAEATPAAPWIFSAPLFVYRLAMLAWALWLAFAVLRWLKWGWGTFSQGGIWAHAPPRPVRPAPPARQPPPATKPALVETVVDTGDTPSPQDPRAD